MNLSDLQNIPGELKTFIPQKGGFKDLQNPVKQW